MDTMSRKQKPVSLQQRIRPYQGAEMEQIRKAEKMAFAACVLSVAGIPAAFLGIGLFMGIAGIVLGFRAKRPNGTRPAGTIVAVVAGILAVLIGIPGCIVIYGTVIDPDSEWVRTLVHALWHNANLIV